ncbi:MAG: hypothetical protein EOP83_04655 [Verrucomicrobiaceae bacterium]|nr:MAG: hypothetical protein EOP83_04655 [Verrucomicrobiaceae bacterium]
MIARYREMTRQSDRDNFPQYGYYFHVQMHPGIKDTWALAKTWCEQQFGPRRNGEVWQTNWLGTIMFKDPDHALEFKLRWC